MTQKGSGMLAAMIRNTHQNEKSLELGGNHFELKITFDDTAAMAIVDGKQDAVQALAEKFVADLEGLLGTK